MAYVDVPGGELVELLPTIFSFSKSSLLTFFSGQDSISSNKPFSYGHFMILTMSLGIYIK